jgi:hypothetical protein
MTIPGPGQTVHLMSKLDVLRVLLSMHSKEGRNVHELKLYTTDDLRHLYQAETGEIIHLRDGVVSRTQLVAVIRWRVFWAQFGYVILLAVSIASASFALLSWRDPMSPAPPPVKPLILSAPQRIM